MGKEVSPMIKCWDLSLMLRYPCAVTFHCGVGALPRNAEGSHRIDIREKQSFDRTKSLRKHIAFLYCLVVLI